MTTSLNYSYTYLYSLSGQWIRCSTM